MRKFARSHWKILIATLLAIALATLTLETDSATPAPDLSARLRAHVQAIAPTEHKTATPRELEQAARHIETTLQGYGYRPHRQQYGSGGQNNIEVSLSNTAAGARPERIFIIGARDNGGGTAAVLELARLLKTMQPGRGTEVRFVFFVNGEAPRLMDEELAPDSGNFIAFVGSLDSSAQVRQALAAFKAQPDFPAEGLAAPAHVMGVTLSDHGSYRGHGYPALMITDTAFLRYPYFHTAEDGPDKPDYAGMARVVKGLARTIDSLAGAART